MSEGASMRLDRDSILKAEDLETEEVTVAEWGGTVLVRALTGTERDAFEVACSKQRPVLDAKGKPVPGRMEAVHNPVNVRAKLAVRCIVDDDGNRVFTDADAGELGKKSAAALDRVFDVASRLSRLSEEDIEDLAGKSGQTPDGDSSSTSPGNSGAPPEESF